MAPLPHWSLQRVSRASEPGGAGKQVLRDADLALYPSVFFPAACRAVTDEDVVITTHATTSRLGAVETMLRRWVTAAPARGCVSVALLLCGEAEWEELVAALARSALLRGHAHISIVLGPWVQFYPYNVMRNAAMEPWNSAHYALLAGIREPACAAAARAAHEAARGSGDPGFLDAAAEGARVAAASGPAALLPRPWLLVLDADGVPSVHEAAMRGALASAAAALEHRTPRAALPRQLLTFVAVEANDTKLSKAALTAFEATAAGDPNASMAFLHADHPHLRPQQWFSMLMPYSRWLHLPLGAEPTRGEYTMHAEPYFAHKAPIPYFAEAFRGRLFDKSGWWWEMAHAGEFTGNVIANVYIFSDSSRDGWRFAERGEPEPEPESKLGRDASWRYWHAFTGQLQVHNCSSRSGGGAAHSQPPTATRKRAPKRRDVRVPLGGGFRALRPRALANLKATLACWDIGEWRASSDLSWMGAHRYVYGGIGHHAGSIFAPARTAAAAVQMTLPDGRIISLPANFSLSAPNLLPNPVYEWHPRKLRSSRCPHARHIVPLPLHNLAGRCAALGARRLLSIGDSLNAGLHDALVELLAGDAVAGGEPGVRYSDPPPWKCPGRMRYGSPCAGHAVCGGAAQLQMRRSDLLWLDPARRPGGGAGTNHSTFAEEFLLWPHGGAAGGGVPVINGSFRLRPHDRPGEVLLGVDDLVPGPPGALPAVIVLNRGIHYRHTEEVLGDLRATLGVLQRGGRLGGPPPPRGWVPPLILWRPTSSFHVNCTTFGPPKVPGPAADAAPCCQSAAVRAMLEAEFPGVLVLPLEAATAMRVDAHANPPKDCLHYLGTGAYDAWARVLFATLELVAKVAGEE